MLEPSAATQLLTGWRPPHSMANEIGLDAWTRDVIGFRDTMRALSGKDESVSGAVVQVGDARDELNIYVVRHDYAAKRTWVRRCLFFRATLCRGDAIADLRTWHSVKFPHWDLELDQNVSTTYDALHWAWSTNLAWGDDDATERWGA